MWSAASYRQMSASYRAKDGLRALVLYAIGFLLLLVQGALNMSRLPVSILESLNLILPLIDMVLVTAFLTQRGESWASIGVTRWGLGRALAGGVIGALILTAVVVAIQLAAGGALRFYFSPSFLGAAILVVGAVAEEWVFRGYLGTRLYGLFKNSAAASMVTALLFLLIHYPVYWVPLGGVTFAPLAALHIVAILALHFFCDAIYRCTNCIWGAVLLHLLYNFLSGVFIVA